MLQGLVRAAGTVEGGRSILKELFLPAVEDRRLKAPLVAQFGNRNMLQQVLPKNGDLLLGCVVLALFRYLFSPLWGDCPESS